MSCLYLVARRIACAAAAHVSLRPAVSATHVCRRQRLAQHVHRVLLRRHILNGAGAAAYHQHFIHQRPLTYYRSTQGRFSARALAAADMSASAAGARQTSALERAAPRARVGFGAY